VTRQRGCDDSQMVGDTRDRATGAGAGGDGVKEAGLRLRKNRVTALGDESGRRTTHLS
jgi:hypothetical protein